MVTTREGIDPVRDELLLACVRGRWDPTKLEEARAIVRRRKVDWNAFWTQARGHGVAPLIYHVLRDDDEILVPWVKHRLRGAYYRSAVHNCVRYRELGEIIRAFDEAGVPVIVLKGAALASAVYSNVAVRPMADVDLLVRKDDMSRGEELLVRAGYVCLDQALSHLRHATFSKRGGSRSSLVELHWHIVSSPYYRQTIPWEWLWQDALQLTMGEASALRLSPEAAIFHTCLHALDHVGIKTSLLCWLCDVVEICQRHTIDWDALVDKAVEFKILLPVRVMLQEAKELLDLPMPDSILQRMVQWRIGFLERKAYESCLSPVRSSASRALFDFMAVRGLKTKFRLLLSRIFPDREYMMARYSIRNSWLVPLYYPYMIGNAVLNGFRAIARPGER